jgi:hypothetical protein
MQQHSLLPTHLLAFRTSCILASRLILNVLTDKLDNYPAAQCTQGNLELEQR